MSTDPTPSVPSPHHPIWQIIRDVIAAITVLASLYAASMGVRNHNKIENVEQKQTEAATGAAEVKQTLEDKAVEDAKKAGIELYTAWKYLDDVAAASGSPRDQAAAAEAKRLYEAHVRKNGAPKQ